MDMIATQFPGPNSPCVQIAAVKDEVEALRATLVTPAIIERPRHPIDIPTT